ncbi:9279_t:CDS:2, partial [Rhizophagus irregularis]
SLTQQQIIRKFKLNNGLILTEGNIQSSMQAIFVEDGALNMSLYEGQPIVYLNINDLQPADVCINFPIAEMAYKDSTNNDPLYNRKINSISDMQFKEAKAKEIHIDSSIFVLDAVRMSNITETSNIVECIMNLRFSKILKK